MAKLIDYASDVTSQSGEDGVIAEIFRRLNITNGWCVEFGAWDGKTLSNTWNLWNERGWQAVLIEGDSLRFTELERQVLEFDSVHAIKAFVGTKGKHSLDSLLERTPLPKNFELLSIDVDGDDYHIWKSFKNYRPLLMVIEHNPTVPPHIDFVDEPGKNIGFGSSALALVKLAEQKGYALICSTATNLFFIVSERLSDLDLKIETLENLFQYEQITYVVSTFGGASYITRRRPAHVEIDSTDGIKNQIMSSIQKTNDFFWPVILIDKKHEGYYGDALRFLSKNAKNLMLLYRILKRIFKRKAPK